MPKYSYRCEDCGSQYEVWHGMTEEHNDCKVCGESGVVRIPALLGDVYISCPEKVGDVVKKAIQDAHREVQDYKKKATKDYYRDDN